MRNKHRTQLLSMPIHINRELRENRKPDVIRSERKMMMLAIGGFEGMDQSVGSLDKRSTFTGSRAKFKSEESPRPFVVLLPNGSFATLSREKELRGVGRILGQKWFGMFIWRHLNGNRHRTSRKRGK